MTRLRRQYIKILLLFISLAAAGGMMRIGFTGGNEVTFRWLLSVSLFATTSILFLDEKYHHHKKIVGTVMLLTLISVVIGMVQLIIY
ncbi:MAG: hypothetical protein WBV93_09740 [Anaerobacillus sp.]